MVLSTDATAHEHAVATNDPRVDPEVEEVRVALALNGGVSLAVWMGGCAAELDRARRTRRTTGDTGSTPPSLYQTLCDAFRRELVIDVMSGSSAGGINGALLGAAIAHDRELRPEFLRERWLRLGDFSRLMEPLSARRPTALMQGRYFKEQLEETFGALIGDPRPDPPEHMPLLDITTTHIAGRVLSFSDTWGGTLNAREFRARFEFRDIADFTAPKLAAAARASASFPFAFEPFKVPAEAAALARGVDAGAHVVDGGLLDNAPIRAALELIPLRSANRQVRRLLCYVNGEPVHVGDPAADVQEPPPSPAAPPKDPAADPRSVIGVVVNLPRKAPFADQLKVLQAVSRNGAIADDAEQQLLTMEYGSLRKVAEALLPTYRRRRRLKALQQELDHPKQVQAAYKLIETDAELPWLQGSLDPDPGEWLWGIDAARRVHEIAVDVLRDLGVGADLETRRTILEARAEIDRHLRDLDGLRRRHGLVEAALRQLLDHGAPVTTAFEAVTERVRHDAPDIAQGLDGTAHALLGALHVACRGARGRSPRSAAELGRGIFDVDVASAPELTPEMHRAFLRRVVAVEVVRRSFTDDDALHHAQQMSFAQLTPEAPVPILNRKPFTDARTPSVDDKLCGVILGHFGGFYRRSWRANDFLWGRMDAAARIVEMLVGAQRSRDLSTHDGHQPWDVLAAALARSGPEQRTLIEEALADADGVPTGGGLEARLRELLRADLERADSVAGRKTRILCTRVVQFEILSEELRHVVAAARHDLKLGCSPSTLGLDDLDLSEPGDVLTAVSRLRDGGCVLPQALGRDSHDELTSDLAARTVAHAALVGLGVSRTAGGALAMPLMSLRSALLPVSGAVSRHVWDRLAVILAFTAASFYLAARISAATTSEVVDARQLSFWELVLAVVAILVVLGTGALPAVRAVLGSDWRRFVWGVVAVLVVAAGGIGAGAVVLVAGTLSWAHLLVAPGVDPPWYATWLPIALGTGAVAGVARPLRKPLEEVVDPPWRGSISWVLVVVAACSVAYWALPQLVDALSGSWWRVTTAVLALAAPAVALVTVVVLPRLLRRRPQRAAAALSTG